MPSSSLNSGLVFSDEIFIENNSNESPAFYCGYVRENMQVHFTLGKSEQKGGTIVFAKWPFVEHQEPDASGKFEGKYTIKLDCDSLNTRQQMRTVKRAEPIEGSDSGSEEGPHTEIIYSFRFVPDENANSEISLNLVYKDSGNKNHINQYNFVFWRDPMSVWSSLLKIRCSRYECTLCKQVTKARFNTSSDFTFDIVKELESKDVPWPKSWDEDRTWDDEKTIFFDSHEIGDRHVSVLWLRNPHPKPGTNDAATQVCIVGQGGGTEQVAIFIDPDSGSGDP